MTTLENPAQVRLQVFPPLPPATSYVLLEFPCIVGGAADADAAFANALAQLRLLLLDDPNALRMKFLTKAHYTDILAEGAHDDDTAFSDNWPLVNEFSWPFGRDNLPASPEALIEEIAKAEAALRIDLADEIPFDAQRLAGLSGMTQLDARFTHWFQGENNIKRIGDGSHDMTFAEILWLLHSAILKDDLGDHIFFEALYGATPDGRDVPLFDVSMGS